MDFATRDPHHASFSCRTFFLRRRFPRGLVLLFLITIKSTKQGLTVPGIVVKMVMRMIRGTVAKTANFNVRDLCPIKHADRTFIPALFVAGLSDDFIKPHHRFAGGGAFLGDACLCACVYFCCIGLCLVKYSGRPCKERCPSGKRYSTTSEAWDQVRLDQIRTSHKEPDSGCTSPIFYGLYVCDGWR